MTEKEIVSAMRICFTESDDGTVCKGCPAGGRQNCLGETMKEAAALIEKLSSENARMKEALMGAPTPCDDCMEVWGNPFTESCADECERLKDFLKEREKA